MTDIQRKYTHLLRIRPGKRLSGNSGAEGLIVLVGKVVDSPWITEWPVTYRTFVLSLPETGNPYKLGERFELHRPDKSPQWWGTWEIVAMNVNGVKEGETGIKDRERNPQEWLLTPIPQNSDESDNSDKPEVPAETDKSDTTPTPAVIGKNARK